ncbi:hypothetical protein E8E12_010146 [Didymella heteroderae]|uniref:Uncharacterized protein n=1 Tax=Didymella heteroderae TaxID=1769908 RepID=A0A9P4WXG9_9PLEO|nr:hypothetical protein E8E12_010146 [Didymella heteroderae]
MERRCRLTYERLISSLERHHDAITVQLPELKDAGRVQDLQTAINVALTTARAGMSGAPVASPAYLKQELKAQITSIHERCDALDKASAHDTHIGVFTPSTISGKKDSPLTSSEQIPALKRAHGTRDSSKENSVPPAALAPHATTRKLSAVKKTPITKRAPISKPPTNTGIKKRSAPNTRSKASTQDLTDTPLSATDDAERLAAADALIGLKHSPETSLTSFTSSTTSSSFFTPSANSRKRAHSVYEDDASSLHVPQSQEPVSSPPTPERRVLAPKRYAEVPALAKGLSVSEVFALGVEYAVQHLPANLRSDGEEMRAWVEQQLGLQVPSPSGVSLSMGVSNNGGEKRGFWDVV